MTDNWNLKKHPSPFIKPRLPHNPAMDYFCPTIKNIGVEISSEDQRFIPVCREGQPFAEILANIPKGELFLTHNSSAIIDCGFNISLPKGYRCKAESVETSLFLSVLDSPRFKLNVFNAGNDLTLTDGQIIAKLWIEPIHFFELIVKETDE